MAKKKVEEVKTRSTCAEDVANLTDEQLLKNKLSWISFKITKKMFTPEEVAEMLLYLEDKAKLKP